MKRNKTIWLIPGLVITIAVALAWIPTLQQGKAQIQDSQFAGGGSFHCNNGAVSGKYTYHLTGKLAGVGDTAVIGTFTQTYDGTFTGQHEALSFNGQIPPGPIPYSGTFSVNSNCVGTGGFTDATGLNVTFKYVVMERGNELHFLNTDAGNVLSGVAKRID